MNFKDFSHNICRKKYSVKKSTNDFQNYTQHPPRFRQENQERLQQFLKYEYLLKYNQEHGYNYIN